MRMHHHKEGSEAVDIKEMMDRLSQLGVSDQTLATVTAINGTTKETMVDILYAHTGYRSFEQLPAAGGDGGR